MKAVLNIKIRKAKKRQKASDSDIVFGLFGSRHKIVRQFVQFVMFIMKCFVLQFQIFEFLVLVETIRLEKICQVVYSF